LGCGNFGGIGSDPRFYGQGESEADAFRLMDRAWELGINFFDTANTYGGGRSESTIGRWLKTKPGHVRDQILVSSKVANPVGEGPNDRGLSRRHILRQVDASLKRLGVERLDMYLIHQPDPTTPWEETLGALDDLVHQGKVHYIGASNIEAWRLARALWVSDKYHLARFEWVPNAYSLLTRDPEREVLPLCEDQGLGFTPFSPLAGGWLTGKYETGKAYPAGSRMTLRPEPYLDLVKDETFQALATFRHEAEAREIDMATLALVWVLSHPFTTAAIIGPRRLEHFEPPVAALEIQLAESDRAELTALFEQA
jgi:aryl-alcohol dehydrogenase-like predicted oxidoreductase